MNGSFMRGSFVIDSIMRGSFTNGSLMGDPFMNGSCLKDSFMNAERPVKALIRIRQMAASGI